MPSWIRRWDMMLPLAVFLGQRRAVTEGLILGFLLAHLYSLCSAAPLGTFVTYVLLMIAIVRLVSYVFETTGSVSLFLLMLALSLVSRLVLVFLSASFDANLGFFTPGWWLLPQLLMNAVMGCLLYWGLSVLDQITFKAPRVNIELIGDRL